MTLSRRGLIRSLSGAAAVFTLDQLTNAAEAWDVRFSNIARQAGLTEKTIFGGEKKNRYLVETTGCGVAFFDYDNDGWLDIFFVNGSRFESITPAATNRLFKNNRDGTFTDVTVKAGLVRTGWGQGSVSAILTTTAMMICSSATGARMRSIATTATGRSQMCRRRLELRRPDQDSLAGIQVALSSTTIAMAGWTCSWRTISTSTARRLPCRKAEIAFIKGLKVACGPPGLPGGKNILFRNNRDGTFKDVSKQAGILNTPGTYGLGVLVSDFDNDGWPDIYVANDSTSSALYRNNHDGTFTEIGIEAGVAYSADGKSQAGMGVSAADYDGDGWLDIVKTNFAGDTSSLYRNTGKSVFEDQTFQAGLGRNTRFLGWGAVFADFDNDGHPDILLANGHVYPEVGDSDVEAGYRQRKVLYRNTGKGRFEDVSMAAGPGITEAASARGLALGDFDNDGDLDAVINCVNDVPQLLRCDVAGTNRWLKVKCIGTRSNRTGIGARVVCSTTDGTKRIDEVRSGGSYLSQSDLRLHFGLGNTTRQI